MILSTETWPVPNKPQSVDIADKVILTINRNDSYCGACNDSCLPDEKSHVAKSGYDQHDGCGATYTHLTSGYVGETMKQACIEMRPDLIWIGFE